MGRLYSLADAPEAETSIEQVLPWVHEAGQPYFDWFFGGPDAARSALRAWMRRPSSEVFVGRVTMLLDGDEPIGGYLALSGAELVSCRRADGLAALREAPRAEWGELSRRVRVSQQLFPRVEHDDYYLSKMGLAPSARGAGRARELVEGYVGDGLAKQFRRLRLDVWDGNERAIGLYTAAGFEVTAWSSSGDAGMTYLAMTLVVDPAPNPPDG